MNEWLAGAGATVWALYGVGGIGKTTLARAAAELARARDRRVAWIDGVSVEPSPRGVWREIADSLAIPSAEPADVLRAIAAHHAGVLLVFDTFERCRQLDGWLRRSFVPALAPSARVLIVGRDAPVPQWALVDGPHGLAAAVCVSELDRAASAELLVSLGLGGDQVAPVLDFARGHPLALRLAARLLAADGSRRLPAATVQPVMDALVQMLHAEVADPALKRALHRAAVVRRVTVSLLAALVPDADAHALFETLAALPMCSIARDGLLIHDAARTALAAHFKAIDPVGYRAARRAAWLTLRGESLAAAPADLWRYTADMLYLVEAPTVHETFFPSSSDVVAVEPAGSDDEAAVMRIAERHAGPEQVALLRRWWSAVPGAFRVTRDERNRVSGFLCAGELARLPRGLLETDPLAASWLRHLADDPVEPHEAVLVLRAKSCAGDGADASATDAALTVDLKRAYVELRPRLRRLYTAHPAPGALDAFMRDVGFRRLPDYDVTIDDVALRVAVLDFGPGSVDGWLSELVAVSVKDPHVAAIALDEAARELVVDGRRLGLTAREFDVMQLLVARAGEAVKRGDLLDEIWGTKYEGGSNVVDVVIRGLRRKLGVRAECIETVTRFGYRLRQP